MLVMLVLGLGLDSV